MTNQHDNLPHTTVLLNETVEALALKPGDVAVDCTVGAGGHSQKLLEAVGKTGLVIGLDRDESALAIATERLKDFAAAGTLKLVKAPFSSVADVLERFQLTGKVQGLCADIGVSSMHLDQADRGFSFMADGPLDMRMDRSDGDTAANLVNYATEEYLTGIFRDFGEEPKARQIARKIVAVREATPFTTTKELADLVAKTVHYPGPSRKHPATRVFQALRIAVNGELVELEEMLTAGFKALRPGGRLAVISFHSLEDRIVKNAFLALTAQRERAKLPRNLPLTDEQLQKLHAASGKIVKPFPLVPSDEEIRQNPRSRSAKLRVIEKLEISP